jgi:hypothetical protein
MVQPERGGGGGVARTRPLGTWLAPVSGRHDRFRCRHA